MPAPTALSSRPEKLAEEIVQQIEAEQQTALQPSNGDIEITTDAEEPQLDKPQNEEQQTEDDTAMHLDADSRAHFAPSDQISHSPTNGHASSSLPSAVPPTLLTKIHSRKIPIPPHRMTPLKSAWPKLYPPLVEHLHLQVRMNLHARAVELRTSRHPDSNTSSLQRGEDFIRAFTLGFDPDDAIALLRLDDLYIETFEIKDVKTLSGDHLGRAIGRIAGKDGKTKFAIENTSRTRVVLADSKVHILGGFQNIRIAREAVVSLILGKPPGKVYGDLRTVGARMKERF